MLIKTACLVAIGLFAYAIEYGLGLTRLPTQLFVYVIVIPVLVLYAVDLFPNRMAGRLKGARSLESADSKDSSARDAVLDFGTIIYAGIYLNVLFRIRPRDWDRFFEIFLVLSPVELFWLAAPITVLWWYRQRVTAVDTN